MLKKHKEKKKKYYLNLIRIKIRKCSEKKIDIKK
jgi:hypothetical protein